MSFIEKKPEKDIRYARIAPICKALWVIFRVLAYVSGILIGLFGVMSVILLFVDVTAEQLIFTPNMSVVTENGVKMFDISLGNGVEVFRKFDEVNADNIRGVAYAGIFTLMAALLLCMPVFHFLSKLMKNVADGKVLSEENASFVNYIGLSIMVGNPIVLLVKRFYNYRLMTHFVEGARLEFDFGIDMFGFVLGLLIIIIGTIYGYACTLHREETALVVRESK